MRCVASAADRVRKALLRSWQCDPGDCVQLADARWSVRIGAERFVVKRVAAAQRARFVAGLHAAQRLHSRGIAAGAPVRAADGAFAVADGDQVIALVRWVPGRALARDDPLDQQWLGSILASVHLALRGFAHPGLAGFYRVRPEAAHLSLEPWLRPAVAAAVAALTKLCVTDQLTYGVLHGAPDPADFRLDPDTGRVGLAEWDRPGTGPLVYDLACAVLCAGGPGAAGELLDAYLSAGTVSPAECEAALPTMLRFAAAVRADRCAARLFAGGQAAADRAGLATARAQLNGP